MAGPQRAGQEAPQAPPVPSEELQELRRQLAATQEQLARVLELMAPSDG